MDHEKWSSFTSEEEKACFPWYAFWRSKFVSAWAQWLWGSSLRFWKLMLPVIASFNLTTFFYLFFIWAAFPVRLAQLCFCELYILCVFVFYLSCAVTLGLWNIQCWAEFVRGQKASLEMCRYNQLHKTWEKLIFLARQAQFGRWPKCVRTLLKTQYKYDLPSEVL